jgi:hypothetical protein
MSRRWNIQTHSLCKAHPSNSIPFADKMSREPLTLVHGQVRITRCHFTNNHATAHTPSSSLCGGGAVWVVHSADTPVVLAGCRFRDNSALLTGGRVGNSIATSGGALSVAASTTAISNCTFLNSLARAVGADANVEVVASGGAVAVSGCLFIRDTVIRSARVLLAPPRNASSSSMGYGGGLHVDGRLQAQRLRITNSGVFTSHTSHGGGLSVLAWGLAAANLTIRDSDISSNTAVATGAASSAAEGGGVWVSSDSTLPLAALQLVRCSVRGNRALLNFTALSSGEAWGGGVFTRGLGLTTVSTNISGNVAWAGGASSGAILTAGGGGAHVDTGAVVLSTTWMQGEPEPIVQEP